MCIFLWVLDIEAGEDGRGFISNREADSQRVLHQSRAVNMSKHHFPPLKQSMPSQPAGKQGATSVQHLSLAAGTTAANLQEKTQPCLAHRNKLVTSLPPKWAN